MATTLRAGQASAESNRAEGSGRPGLLRPTPLLLETPFVLAGVKVSWRSSLGESRTSFVAGRSRTGSVEMFCSSRGRRQRDPCSPPRRALVPHGSSAHLAPAATPHAHHLLPSWGFSALCSALLLIGRQPFLPPEVYLSLSFS